MAFKFTFFSIVTEKALAKNTIFKTQEPILTTRLWRGGGGGKGGPDDIPRTTGACTR